MQDNLLLGKMLTKSVNHFVLICICNTPLILFIKSTNLIRFSNLYKHVLSTRIFVFVRMPREDQFY